MDHAIPHQLKIIRAAATLVDSVGPSPASALLIDQFGWDVAFLALAHLDGARSAEGLWACLEEAVYGR